MVDLSFAFGLAVLAYFVAIGAGVVLAAGALLLGLRVRPFARALGYVAAVTALVLVVLATTVAVIAGAESGFIAFAVAFLTLTVVWAVPVAVGRAIVVRTTGLTADGALRHAAVGLPVALVASAAVFVAPGGLERYNILFLDGPVAVLAWLAFGAVLVLGPGIVGVAVARMRGGRKNDAVPVR